MGTTARHKIIWRLFSYNNLFLSEKEYYYLEMLEKRIFLNVLFVNEI